MDSEQKCTITSGHALRLDCYTHFTDEEAEARRPFSCCERVQGGQQGGTTLTLGAALPAGRQAARRALRGVPPAQCPPPPARAGK